MTIPMLIDWIMANRRGKAFAGYTREVIAQEIDDGIRSGTFRYCLRADVIVGVVCSQIKGNVFYVHDILTTQPGVAKEFIREFSRCYPTYTLAGYKPKQKKSIVFTRTNRMVNLYLH